jgi:hypothetical protein
MKRVYLGSNIVWQNAPTAIAATGVGTTSFTANWEAYSGAVLYYLDVSETSDFSTFVYENEIVYAPTTSYVVIGLQSNTTYYYRVRANDEYDPDYQAVLNYATTQNYTKPSFAQRGLQNQLVIDLKDAGIWNKLDTFAVFATDGDEDFALIDWKRVTNYTAVNSPSFTPNQGFKGNGFSNFINANFNDTDVINYSQDSASIGVYCYVQGTNSGYFGGFGTSTFIRATGSANNRINSTLRPINFDFNVVGLQSMNRDTATTQQYITNGIVTNASDNSTTFSGNLNFLSLSIGSPSDAGISFAFLGGDLSSEALNFYNITNNYVNSL